MEYKAVLSQTELVCKLGKTMSYLSTGKSPSRPRERKREGRHREHYKKQIYITILVLNTYESLAKDFTGTVKSLWKTHFNGASKGQSTVGPL